MTPHKSIERQRSGLLSRLLRGGPGWRRFVKRNRVGGYTGCAWARNSRLRASLRLRGLQRHLEAHIAWLDDAIRRLEADLTALIRSTPIWREADELLRSVPGVGPVTSCARIADLPELGHLDRRRIAALAGLPPVARDSGAFRGRRMIVGGRAHVRRILYMERHHSESRWPRDPFQDRDNPGRAEAVGRASQRGGDGTELLEL